MEISQKIRQFWRFLGQRGPQKSPKNWREKISSKKFWASLKIFYRNLRQNTQNRRFSDFVGTGHCKFLVVFWRSQNFGFHRFIVVFLAKAKNLGVFCRFLASPKSEIFLASAGGSGRKSNRICDFSAPKIDQNRRFCKFWRLSVFEFFRIFPKNLRFFRKFQKKFSPPVKKFWIFEISNFFSKSSISIKKSEISLQIGRRPNQSKLCFLANPNPKSSILRFWDSKIVKQFLVWTSGHIFYKNTGTCPRARDQKIKDFLRFR